MLVLMRKKDEQLIINDDIIVTVLEIRGETVKLGIEAPKKIPVHRTEVYREIAAGADGTRQCKSTSPSPR